MNISNQDQDQDQDQDQNKINQAITQCGNRQYFTLLGLNNVMEAGRQAIRDKEDLDQAIKKAVEENAINFPE